MPEQMIFHFVFLSQVLLISFYLPRAILSRVRYVVETYPPSKYPKLYPAPIEAVEKAQRNYRYMNLFALLAGFVLLFIGLYSPTEEMLNWDSVSVLGLYFLLQYSPFMITSGFAYFNFKRRADSRTIRKADLHPRRLFDFISPVTIGIAIFVYVAFVGFIIYVRQFEFSWFGGWSQWIDATLYLKRKRWSVCGKGCDSVSRRRRRRRYGIGGGEGNLCMRSGERLASCHRLSIVSWRIPEAFVLDHDDGRGWL